MELSSVTVGHFLNHLNNSDRRNHRDHEEADIHHRDPIGHVAQRQLDGNAQVLLFKDPAELVGDGPDHLLGYQVQPRGQAMSGARTRGELVSLGREAGYDLSGVLDG